MQAMRASSTVNAHALPRNLLARCKCNASAFSLDMNRLGAKIIGALSMQNGGYSKKILKAAVDVVKPVLKVRSVRVSGRVASIRREC